MENENNGNEALTLQEVARILTSRTNQIYELMSWLSVKWRSDVLR